MRMIRILLVVLFLACLAPSPAAAGSPRLRDLADSEFRIAQKAYRDAVRRYGEDVRAMPVEEKGEACRKIGRALYDNKIQVTMQDPFGAMQMQKQVNALEDYSKALLCK